MSPVPVVLTRSALCALVLGGCTGKYAGSGGTTPVKPAGPRGGIAAAALPYQIVDGRTGRHVDEPAFWERVGRARAICVGEEHPNPHHHWVQLHVVGELGKRKPVKLGLGLEMVQRPFQGVLDDYTAKRIDDATLRSRVGWEDRWGYDWGFYGPTIDAVIGAGGQVIALNAARELTKKVSRQGLESLTPDERAQLPELKLDVVEHRAWFDALMSDLGGHGHGHGQPAAAGDPTSPHDAKPDKPAKAESAPPPGSPPAMPSMDRIYTVQVLWDETMADLAAKWLAANPSGQLVILAGNGHCHDSAIVGRLKRRGIADAISLRPVIDVDGGVAEVLAKPMNDYVIVLQMPK
ncbi:MAG: ChaN family lipoprotein [Myxococcota bacterium]|nr:ChaN family lipoprotein [Myxococcota bacterium]